LTAIAKPRLRDLPDVDGGSFADGETPVWGATAGKFVGEVGAGRPARLVTAATALTANDSVLLADATGQASPSNVVAARVPSGGTFAAGVWLWTVTAVGPSGESIGPPGVTTGFFTPVQLNDAVTLTWTAAPGATGYKIYRSVFDYGNITATDLRLVATVGAVATYTDTGTATTSPTPPATNGGAFTVTLPTAVGFARGYTIKAVGQTPNLVTLATTASQTIDGASTLQIGVATHHQAVTLASDGSNWRVVESVANAPKVSQAGNVYSTSCGATATAVAVVACPALIPFVTKLAFICSMSITPGAATTALTPSIYRCTSAGVIVNNENIAFWNPAVWAPGEQLEFAANWFYDPRHGDVNMEDGAGRYFGLFLTSAGASSQAFSAMLQVVTLPLASAYWPTA